MWMQTFAVCVWLGGFGCSGQGEPLSVASPSAVAMLRSWVSQPPLVEIVLAEM